MKAIIPPVERNLLYAELTQEYFLRNSNFGNKQIYVVTAQSSPNLMREIGRLREECFRMAGGGSGDELDIDEFDTKTPPHNYKQLIVWDPEDEEIVGGYRFIEGANILKKADGELDSAVAEIFDFSQEFCTNYLPYMIELGRSFVQLKYQPTVNARKGIYSLDNLWDGLGALIVNMPEMKYFFGKVTVYPQMDKLARDMVLYLFEKHFPDTQNLVVPKFPVQSVASDAELQKIFTGSNYKEDYLILSKQTRILDAHVPPLINAYMALSSTMKSFGASENIHWGGVEEIGVMVTIPDIYTEKKDRHINSYQPKQSL